MNVTKAKEFIYKNARPLDCARWQYLFENGSRENVLNFLAVYQNGDGGFGHALEADCWSPDSSPVQTWAATQIIREIDLKEKEHPIILGILRYLENTKYFDGHVWANSIPSNEAYPHAPWWNYADVNEVNYNPTASLIGFILLYASPESSIYQTAQRLLQEAYDWFKLHCPLESMHTASCFVELFEDLVECNISGIDLSEFESLLQLQIKHILTADTSVWASEYVCKPSLMIHSRNSRFYEENKELCNFECHFLSETQQEDGTWAVTWDWGCYPEQWHISKHWWKSDLIIKNVKFYRSMQYEVKIDPQLWKVYSEIRLGVIQFTAVVRESDEQFWHYMDDKVLPQVKQEIEGKEWGEIPGIRGSRAAYKAFGRNPGRYRVSSEALIRRVRRGDELYHINSVVDVNNLLSVKSGLSVGSYDLDKLHGTVTLRKAKANEGYTGIGKDFIDMENMLVLADDEGIFGSSMSDSTRAMVTENTRNVLVVVYCFENSIDLSAILERGKKAFTDFADVQDAKIWIVGN